MCTYASKVEVTYFSTGSMDVQCAINHSLQSLPYSWDANHEMHDTHATHSHYTLFVRVQYSYHQPTNQSINHKRVYDIIIAFINHWLYQWMSVIDDDTCEVNRRTVTQWAHCCDASSCSWVYECMYVTWSTTNQQLLDVIDIQQIVVPISYRGNEVQTVIW